MQKNKKSKDSNTLTFIENLHAIGIAPTFALANGKCVKVGTMLNLCVLAIY